MKALVKDAFHRLMNSYFSRLTDNQFYAKLSDIDLHRQLMATRSTVRFIERHAATAEVFRSRDELLRRAAELARTHAGLICEFGVFQGASINLLANCLPEREIYGFDSFEGLPATWRVGFLQGSFSTSGTLPAVRSNVSLIKGWFSDTLGEFLAQHPQPAALLHIDCDLYASTKTVLDALQPRIRPGTLLVFDEYFNYPGWQKHEHKAFQEFVRETRLDFEYVAYNAAHQQVIVRCTGSSR